MYIEYAIPLSVQTIYKILSHILLISSNEWQMETFFLAGVEPILLLLQPIIGSLYRPSVIDDDCGALVK
jgi:hypothetical protein